MNFFTSDIFPQKVTCSFFISIDLRVPLNFDPFSLDRPFSYLTSTNHLLFPGSYLFVDLNVPHYHPTNSPNLKDVACVSATHLTIPPFSPKQSSFPGSYLFVDLSVPHSHPTNSPTKDVARIVGDPFDNSAKENRCVSFFWRMEGGATGNVGKLNVYVTMGKSFR